MTVLHGIFTASGLILAITTWLGVVKWDTRASTWDRFAVGALWFLAALTNVLGVST